MTPGREMTGREMAGRETTGREVTGDAFEAPAAGLTGFDRDVVLATGRVVRVRRATSADAALLHRFYDGLSDRSAYLRFFGRRPALSDDHLAALLDSGLDRGAVMVAVAGDDVVGAGECWRIPDGDAAEVAFAVADAHQHEGIATVLLEDLAQIARAAGVRRLVAETLPGNLAMRDVFAASGLPQRVWYDAGEMRVEARSDGRDWTAAVESLRPLLHPRHVVVIGAGRDPSSPGRVVLANLLATFPGRISVVHPRERVVGGVSAVGAVAALDTPADVAVVVVPATAVGEVVDECGRGGVRTVVVISAGFAEVGGDGVARERELLATVRRYGMRLVGPNCLGVVSTAAGLNATFMRQQLSPGPIAIASQSGGVGIVLAAEAARRQLGVSSFVSLGNKADVSGNDLLRLWADDPSTRVGLMYLESIGDPVRFARIARAVSRRLPVVALKGGRSDAGRRGARSHTGALAADDLAVDALFAHTGVMRARTMDQLLDVGALLARQPAPVGRRIALLGNSGGPLILAADAAAANGLVVPEFTPGLQRRLRELVPGAASTTNPVDLLATATAAQRDAVLAEVAASGEVDACAVITVDLDDGSNILRLDWDHPAVPAVGVLLGGVDATGTMPTFPTPERAMDALGLAADRGEWLTASGDDHLAQHVDVFALRRTARRHSRTATAAASVGGPVWLPPADTFEMLDALGVPTVPWAVGTSTTACVEHARTVGFPCVLKADVVGVLHKSDGGAVELGVSSATEVNRVVGRFRRRFGERLRGVLVQHQAAAGVELLVGAVRDPAIGPLVVVAAGGTDTELTADRVVMLAPVTARQARRALESLRMFPRLNGFRGRPAVPIDPLIDIVERVGLLHSVPEIVELDINPIVAGPDRSTAVDARIAVLASPVAPLRGLRGPAAPVVQT